MNQSGILTATAVFILAVVVSALLDVFCRPR